MKELITKNWHFAVILLGFVCIACVYMSPELSGQRIGSNDNVQAICTMGEELRYTAFTGKQSWWNGALFSGMPNYQIGGANYESDKWLSPIVNTLHKGYSSPIFLVLLYLVCFYVLLLSMKMGRWLSLIGAIAMAFSSYFFIIIGAGHVTKATSMALMTLALAGCNLIFHDHRKTGICLCLIGTAAGFAPHPQMTYYIAFLFVALGCVELWNAYKSKAWKSFGINCAIALASLGTGVGTSVANTFANMEYVKETVRGGESELVQASADKPAKGGLNYNYATEHSYGVDECLTFLIPNYKGGSSFYKMNLDQKDYDRLAQMGVPADQMGLFDTPASLYWGDQETTMGPVYLGAIIVFLFVLALLVVRGPYKWALLGVTLLSVLLSLGYHFELLTKLFFDYFPWFNKFRAVSSILVIAEIAVPLLAIMGLKEIIEGISNDTLTKKVIKKNIYISAGITIGICLLTWLLTPMFGSYLHEGDPLTAPDGSPNIYVQELVNQRHIVLNNDVWRSVILIALSALSLLLYMYGKLKKQWLIAGLAVLVLFDMWTVNKRYTNDSFFKTPNDYSAIFQVQPWERLIHENDTTPGFRIMSNMQDEGSDARAAYRFRNIKGYHAAKLRRYDDVLREHINKQHGPVISMLNAKYIINKDASGEYVVGRNPDAMGTAWFVEKLVAAKTAKEESDDLMKLDLHKEAVIGADFAEYAKNMNPGADSTATVSMTKYEPDCLQYEAKCSKAGTIVFSEVYYPYGWKAYVDDKPVDHYRVNYILRALNIEPGEHKIRFEFRPESVEKGNTISMIFVILMYLAMAGCVVLGIKGLVVGAKKA